MNNNNTTNSNSKQKRIDRQAAIAKEARAKKKKCIIAVTACAACVGLLVGGTILARNARILKYLASDIEQETDFSAYLTSKGKIEGVKVSDYIDPIDISSITVSSEDVEFTDDDVESYVEALLDEYKTLDTEDTERTAETGDTVSIDFTGSIDGEEFDNGSAEGYDLTLGSGTLIDDFEDQLVGARIGEDLTITVTFPEDYGVDELNGKDADFAVHVNGIYDRGEFNDEFVQTNLSDYGYDTAEEFKAAYKEEQITNLYYEAVNNWISKNITPDDLPAVYLHHVKGLTMTNDEAMYEQYKTMYEQYGISFDYDSYKDYYSTDNMTYEEARDEEASTTVIRDLVYQSICENEKIKVTNEDYEAFIKYNNIDEDTVTAYGKPYITKSVLQYKVVEYLIGNVTVEETAADHDAETDDTVAEAAEADISAEDTASTEETETVAENADNTSTADTGSDDVAANSEASEAE